MSDVSRIKLPNGSEYNLADTELRHMMNVLLGLEDNCDNNQDIQEPSEENDKKEG